MNTNPSNEAKPYGEKTTWQLGYFHECMSGFEHQVASHMMAEGMTDEALILTRMIHDRYYAGKRNPFNEIECSDHYARAMASYGTFISACGFDYDGPNGYIKFAPKLNTDKCKIPFTSATAWGSYEQLQSDKSFSAILKVKYGSLFLNKITLDAKAPVTAAKIYIGTKLVKAKMIKEGQTFAFHFENKVELKKGQELKVNLS